MTNTDLQTSVPDDASRLLALVARGSRVTFQTFDDNDKRKDKRLSKVLDGALVRHAQGLSRLNDRGAGVFFMVNEGDGRGRSARNVIKVRAVFLDLDGAPLGPVLDGPLKPHAIVQSSSERYHCYWLVDSLPLDEFRAIQQRIAARFHGDAKVIDLCRVMRLPGYRHQKGAPFLSRIESIDDRPPYSANEVRQAFADKPRLVLAESIPKGERNVTLFALARGLVNKGLDANAVNKRIQKINAERCEPPLCAKEVDDLVASAVSHGSSGFTVLPDPMLDSDAYRGLSHAARTILVGAYRRYNGSNDGNISLPFEDFAGYGFSNKTFYEHRRRLVKAGLLRVVSKANFSREGKRPDLFALGIKP
ncbi:DNA-primase RepB domain-containing protein [Lysobacter sp. GCM10012299]|uniref:DNA-primase RepB domain-containing protein n=1 Tax=Lysobacter sp. GCM10012299 TaxID=3317333 RepID=UPI003617F0EB